MSKKKRRSGHYCKICSKYKSNESFSGKGHANHICKKCSKRSPTEQVADMTLNRLSNMPFRKLSPAEKSWLENRLHDQREEVKLAAQEIYKHLYPHAERNNRKKQLHINKLSFRIHSSGTHVYLPEKVEALYSGFQEFFTPAYSEEEECEEDMDLQGGIDDLPF